MRKHVPWLMYPIAAVLEIGHGLARAVDAARPHRPSPALRRREHSTAASTAGPHPGRAGREGRPRASSRAQHRAWRRERDSRDPGCNRRRPWCASWLALAQSDSSTPSTRSSANTGAGKADLEQVGRCRRGQRRLSDLVPGNPGRCEAGLHLGRKVRSCRFTPGRCRSE